MVLGELLPNVNELFEWKGIVGPNTWYGLNKVGMMALISTFICIVLFWYGGTRRKLVPVGMQNAAEAGYLAIEDNVSIAAMGEEGRKWTPLCG